MNMTWGEIYVRHLLGSMGNYCPLPIPSPSRDTTGRPFSADGVRVGDVGIFKYDESFETLLNVAKPEDSPPTNSDSLLDPQSMAKFELDVRVQCQGMQIIAPEVQCSPLRYAGVYDTESTHHLEVTNGPPTGALLWLPQGSFSHNLRGRRDKLEACIWKNYHKWLTLAEQQEGTLFDAQTVCLVTGIVKCPAWAIAVWKGISVKESALQLKASRLDDHYSWETLPNNCNLSCHPNIASRGLWRQITYFMCRFLPSFSSWILWKPPCNQDVFVRGYWITRENPISTTPPPPPSGRVLRNQDSVGEHRSSVDVEAGAEGDGRRSQDPTGGGRSPTRSAHRDTNPPWSRSFRRGADSNDGSMDTSTFTRQLQVNTVDRDWLTLGLGVAARSPCELINRFALALYAIVERSEGSSLPRKRCAISHDDDWNGIVKELEACGEAFYLDEFSFIRKISSKLKFVIDKDIIRPSKLLDNEKGLVDHYMDDFPTRDSISIYVKILPSRPSRLRLEESASYRRPFERQGIAIPDLDATRELLRTYKRSQERGRVNFPEFDEMLRLRGESAQARIDSLEKIANSLDPTVDQNLRLSSLELLIRLSKLSGLLPQCIPRIKQLTFSKEGPFAGGAQGRVWRAKVGGMADCAVKIAPCYEWERNEHADQEREQVFEAYLQEAIIWKRLDHPNVLPLLGIHWENDVQALCLVTYYLPERSLKVALDCEKARKKIDTYTVVYDIASALEYLHSQNVVHGDLSDNSILMTEDFRACLCDFGLSHFALPLEPDKFSTRLSGEPGYMSPSSLKSRRPSEKADDVYAFGHVCYEILVKKHIPAGRRPTIAEFPPKLAEYQGYRELWTLIQDCRKKDGSTRPSAGDLVRRVVEIIEDLPSTGRLEKIWNPPEWNRDVTDLIQLQEQESIEQESIDASWLRQ
ncbi:hypothetical protein V5O48_007024 [Marasmius crinis-equi]|uniref:Protein kinase domain-containing protein n=1 Tax=Marasmius crinis-equi TaxID=585013 RepID=A0ABR3FHY8_9AGAR